MKRKSIASIIFLALLGAAGAAHYRVEKTLAVGGEGRWDYLMASDNRLYVPRSTHTTILDAATGKTLGDIPATAGVHGVALLHALHRGYTSNGGDGTCTVFDTDSLVEVAKVPTVAGADCIIYDPFSRQVLSFSGKNQSMVALEVDTFKTSAPLALGGKAEYAVSDGAGHVWVNIEDKAEVVKIDMRKRAVESRFAITGGEEPTGLSLDAATQRLFIGCHNSKLVVMDSQSGKIVATLPIGARVDATAFDSGNVMASCGDGHLWIYHEDSPDRYSLVQTLTTEPGARTMAVDAASHKVYLPTATLISAANEDRPKAKPGTFRILVVGNGR